MIVHLSSLDSYTDGVGYPHGERLGWSIKRAILEHDGPIYIVDQGWEVGRRESRPREDILASIAHRTDIRWIKFDEDVDDWDKFLPLLLKRLKADKVKRVIVGGIWYDPELKTGCATAVYLFLREHLPTEVDEDIVGCEE